MATATIRDVDVFASLPTELLVPSPHNPRKHFDDARLEELAQSIREAGIVEPLVVRKMDLQANGLAPFEIIAGERRYRAAQLAGLTSVPAIVRAYTDEQVAEIVLIENLQRQDLTPLEQAAGFKALHDSNPTRHSLSAIAVKVGKSEAWVWDRLKLNDLIPDAKQLLADERITVGHAILLSRLKPEDQKRAVDPRHPGMSVSGGLWRRESYALYNDEEEAGKDKYAGLMPVAVRELDGWIKSQVRFDVAHAAKAQPLVFAETAAQVAAAEAEPGRGRKVIPITYDHRVSDAAKDESERTYGRESWVRADGQEKSKTCEHSVLGVVVAGLHQGTTLRVCIARDKCRVHYGGLIKAKEKAAKQRASGDTKKAAKTEKKAQETWQQRVKREQAEREREQKAFEAFKPVAIRAIAAAIPEKPFTDAAAADILASEALRREDQAVFTECLGGPVTVQNFMRARALADVIDRAWSQDRLERNGKQHGVDVKALRKQHDAALKAAAAAQAPAADGKNADGKNADGKNADGKNADGKNADGKNADGKKKAGRKSRAAKS